MSELPQFYAIIFHIASFIQLFGEGKPDAYHYFKDVPGKDR
jgi:hypothetical protein